MKKMNALFLLAVVSLAGCAFQVPLSNNLSASSLPVTGNKLPLNVGLVIDTQTKSFQQKVKPTGGAQVHTFTFSVGEELSNMIPIASKASFEKVTVIDSLPKSPSKDFDAYLIVRNLKADIKIGYTKTGEQIAMGALLGPLGTLSVTLYKKTDASLSVSVRVVDSNLSDVFSSTVSGKGNSLVPSSFSGINPEEFSSGANDALQDLAKNLEQELLNSSELKAFAEKIRTRQFE